MKKISLKQHCFIGNAMLAVALGLAFIGALLGKDGSVHFLVWLALGLALGSAVYKMAAIRCPHCTRSMNVRYKLPDTCPHCHKAPGDEDAAHG